MRHRLQVSRAIDEIAQQMAASAEPEKLVAIMWKYDLTDDEFSSACDAAVLIRQEQLEAQNREIETIRKGLFAKAAHWGQKQAEIEILNKPLPWTRAYFIEIADLAADHHLDMTSSGADKGDEYAMQLIVDMAGTARNAFIARVSELMKIASPEARS